jgi:hypothetical protein
LGYDHRCRLNHPLNIVITAIAAFPTGEAAIFCPELSRSGAWTVVKLTVRLEDSGGIARLMAIARNILGSIEKGRQLAALVIVVFDRGRSPPSKQFTSNDKAF